MDPDEFDDDILDEDLIAAATQASSQSHRPSIAVANRASIIDLDDWPSNDFPSPFHGASSLQMPSRGAHQATRVGGPPQAYRQTTLFGLAAQMNANPETAQQRLNSNRVFRADLPVEAVTHHEIDREAMETWVYPTNLGAIRDYQYTIVKQGLFNNTLVALPTGLGKTFIAAAIMLNFFRWTKSAKIIFVAPTKPLVSQQVEACFNIVGIPRSQTTLLTGEVSPGLRAEEWEAKRVFFMTPQTLENDLSSGIADPKSIGLLVVDEAHRATGNYAYVKVVTFMRRFTSSFRVLALTATPGSKVEAVQEVIDNLGISSVEIRTEESLDLRQYVHRREEDIVVLDPTEEMVLVQDLFSKALKPLVDKLSQQNIYYGRDPMALTTYGLMKAKKDWFSRAGQHANQGIKFMMMAVFTILQGLAHSIKLLKFHGIKPFYENLVHFRDEAEAKGEKGSKFKRQVIDSPDFQKMMSTVSSWVEKDDFVSHPKLTSLCDTVLNHFLDAGDGREGGGSSKTRIIVFSEYRDSAEEIVRVLNRQPMIRAGVFVGQADTKKSDGMKQSEQIERIRKFKDGSFNVLVATSIGEEGLDIGQVDLIICYDASASPIRMLQRMGRTGRKRAGRVVLLLMRGKEEENYAQSKDGYMKMQQMICDGSRFSFRHDLSTRIVPREIRPEVDKRFVEIPIENTQNQSLPEPKKGGPKKKKPPKKFRMPDGVETGFNSVASLLGKTTKAPTAPTPCEEDDIADIPTLDKVLLNTRQISELHHEYQNLPFYQDTVEEVETVDMTANPVAQRTLRKTVALKHGERTKRYVRLFQTLSRSQSRSERYHKPYGDLDQSHYEQLPFPNNELNSEDEPSHVMSLPPPRKKRKQEPLFNDNGLEDSPPMQARKPKTKVRKPSRVTTSRKPRVPPQRESLVRNNNPIYDVEEGIDDADQPELTSIRSRKPSKPKTSRNRPVQPKRGRPPKSRQSHEYDESADDGDDCRRTSDLELTDDSDDGSDLVGFIVGDDIATSSVLPTSSMRLGSTSPITSSSSNLGRPSAKHKPYYKPSQFTATQDSEDDIPSLSQVVVKKKEAPRKPRMEEEIQEGVIRRPGRGAKRRVVLDDDDDDDD